MKRVNGVDVQVMYTPKMRAGDWLEYMISVQPYSMARQDPNVKAKRIQDFIASGTPAIAQAAQPLGPAFNVDGALNLRIREAGIEEGDELINSAMLQQSQMLQMQLVPPNGNALGAQPAPLPRGGRPQ